MQQQGVLGHMQWTMLQVWMIKAGNSLLAFKMPKWQYKHLLTWRILKVGRTLILIHQVEMVILTWHNSLSQLEGIEKGDYQCYGWVGEGVMVSLEMLVTRGWHIGGLRVWVAGSYRRTQSHKNIGLPFAPNTTRVRVEHANALRVHSNEVTPFHNTCSHNTHWELEDIQEGIDGVTMDVICSKHMAKY